MTYCGTLARKLAPNSEQIGSSSSPGLQDTSDLGPVYDDDDDADMRLPDPPRLSFPSTPTIVIWNPTNLPAWKTSTLP